MFKNRSSGDRRKVFVKVVAYFVILMSVNFLLWQMSRLAVTKNARNAFRNQSSYVKMLIAGRVESYLHELKYGKRLFDASTAVNRSEFHKYYENMNKDSHGQGIEGMLFVKAVKKNEVEAYVDSVRKDKTVTPYGYPFFTPSLSDSVEDHNIITYLEPESSFLTLFGWDINMDASHMAYFDKAAITGKTVISGPVEFFSNSRILMIEPVYEKSKSPVGNPALNGFLVLMLNIDHLFDGVLDGLQGPSMTYNLYEGSVITADTPILYQDGKITHELDRGQMLKEHSPIRLLDKQFMLEFISYPNKNDVFFEQDLSDVFFLVISALSFYLFFIFMRSFLTAETDKG